MRSRDWQPQHGRSYFRPASVTESTPDSIIYAVLDSSDEIGKSAHALRHSYAVQLYRAQKDIRAVQKQLRHSSIQTTQKYADCLPEDIAEQIHGLWN
jgi:site-specific recombinase XerD